MRILRERGARVTVLPWDATAEQVLRAATRTACCSATAPATRPRCPTAWRRCASWSGQVPVFGICLGHQLLGRALGLETFKLRFGHRGANHPVLDVDSGRVLVTAQNHGFAVRVPDGGGDLETDFGPARVTHVSLYDGTVEGLALREPAGLARCSSTPRPAPGRTTPARRWRRFVGTPDGGDRCLRRNDISKIARDRLRPDRDRPGLRVRLLRHPGAARAARRGLRDGADQLQPGHDHDRPRLGRPTPTWSRSTWRACGRCWRRSGRTPCCRRWAGRPRSTWRRCWPSRARSTSSGSS